MLFQIEIESLKNLQFIRFIHLTDLSFFNFKLASQSLFTLEDSRLDNKAFGTKV